MSKTLRLIAKSMELERRVQAQDLTIQQLYEQVKQLEDILSEYEAKLAEVRDAEERLWWAQLFGVEAVDC